MLHIEMRRWADVLIVAPASANVIAKAAYGISDNFVLSVIRAWDFSKPCALCPAMNTVMWTHPTTKESLDRLQSWGWEVLGPVEKMLACNDRGMGAMVSLNEIKAFLVSKFFQRSQGTADAPHALTNSNLQLHSLLLNSSGSSGTTVDSSTSKGKEGTKSKHAHKNDTKDDTPHAEDANFKQKLTAMHSASSKVAQSTPAAAVAVPAPAGGAENSHHHQMSSLSPSDDTKKRITDSAAGVTDKAPTPIPTVSPSSSSAVAGKVAKKFGYYAFQSLLLGVGLGVGIVLSSTLISFFAAGNYSSGDIFSIRPGAGKQASI